MIAIGAPQSRLDLPRELGADVTLSIEDDSIEARAAAARDLTSGRGADVIMSWWLSAPARFS